MNDTISPEPIIQMLQGAQAASVLRTAIDLGVFDAIADDHHIVSSIAARVQADERATTILLNALCAFGLLKREQTASGAAYELVPMSAAFLCRSQPTFVGGLGRIFASPHLSPHHDALIDSVRAGGATTDQHAETPEHPFWNDFAVSSAAMAGPAGGALAGVLAERLNDAPDASILDVACGSGLYGLQLAAACPNATLHLQDWQSVLDHHTRAAALEMGLGERTRFVPGDLFEVDLAGPHACVIASHLFHHFDPATCAKLMRRLGEVTAPGGTIAIHDFVVEEDAPSEDPMPYIFSALMLAWTPRGQAYTRQDYTAWLTEAGFEAPEILPSAGLPSKFLIARRRA